MDHWRGQVIVGERHPTDMDSFSSCSGLEFMTPAMFRDLLVNYLKSTRREPRAQHVGGVDRLMGGMG